nr:MAG TPA: hypothetical protein [Caudoviricetes sp.]
MQSLQDIRIQNPKQFRGAYHGYQKVVTGISGRSEKTYKTVTG